MKRGSTVDFGVKAMADAPADLNRRQETAPLMFPAHVDCWAQTNPAPAADADVAPFLHGPKAIDPADVQIVWRADLPDEWEDWLDVLKAAPPLSTEALPLPMRAARQWLAGGNATVWDQEGAADGEEPANPKRLHWIWRGPDQKAERIRPGDTIVVRSTEGGWDEFGWKPDSDRPVKDIGDLCANERAAGGGGKYRLRVHPDVWDYGPDETRDELVDLLKRAANDDEEAEDELRQKVKQRIPELAGARPKNYGASGAVLFEKRVARKQRTDDSEEGDETSLREGLEGKIWLDEHMGRVAERARRFLEACGLNGDTGAAVERAAALHDVGKEDYRFQLMLGNTGDRCVAKGDGGRRRDHGYPKGARHEFASVAEAGCDSELALYLIGTHHGHGRPFAAVWKDEGLAAELARIGSGWTERFWAMNRRYGWWGLAYLEALLRKADWMVSAEEERACKGSN
jgi:CRISPR-associated endonuclease/helicase Cas3